MNRKLVPGDHLKQLIERTESTGKNDCGVAEIVHLFFANMHIIYYQQLRYASMLSFPCYQYLRNNADRFTIILHYFISDPSHDPNVATTIDKRNAVIGHQLTKIKCMLFE
jgi:hypothetical protein